MPIPLVNVDNRNMYNAPTAVNHVNPPGPFIGANHVQIYPNIVYHGYHGMVHGIPITQLRPYHDYNNIFCRSANMEKPYYKNNNTNCFYNPGKRVNGEVYYKRPSNQGPPPPYNQK